jgi:hypothetical protein
MQLSHVARGSEPAAESGLSHPAARPRRKPPSLLTECLLIWESMIGQGRYAVANLAALPVHPNSWWVTVDHVIVRNVVPGSRTQSLGRGASMRK